MESNTFSILVQLLFAVSQCQSVLSIAPVIPAVVAAAVSGLYAGYEYVNSSREICNVRNEWFENRMWIKHGDEVLTTLNTMLEDHLYGQPLAKRIITKALKHHIFDEEPKKALVLSLHGWSGSGKNYASQLIAKSLYRKGADSKFVHVLPATNLFTDPSKVEDYKRDLKLGIESAVRECPRQLFILDEVEKMPAGLVEVLAAYMGYHHKVDSLDHKLDSLDYRKCIFIFVSNIGGYEINRVAHDFWLEGKQRNDIKLKDLEPLIHKAAFNEVGGLHKSDIVAKSLIDFHIPFLPLEKRHVKLCARDHIYTKYATMKEKANDEFLEQVASDMEYFPPKSEVYSKTGCKKVHKKVDMHLID